MPATTFTDIGEAAFALLNVYLPGEAMSDADGTAARLVANRMLSGWGRRSLFIPVIARERFDLVADQGGPDDPYTIGSGGDFDTERPSNQNSITAANLILTDTDPEVRVSLGIYTSDAYDANAIPGMSNSQPTGLYYNPTYDGDLGSIFLWPVPDTADNDIELFLQKPIAQFADLSTTYYLPDGAEDAIVYQLAKRLAGPYGKVLSAADLQIATEVLGAFKRGNVQLSDLATDAHWSGSRRTYYNIQSGS